MSFSFIKWNSSFKTLGSLVFWKELFGDQKTIKKPIYQTSLLVDWIDQTAKISSKKLIAKHGQSNYYK